MDSGTKNRILVHRVDAPIFHANVFFGDGQGVILNDGCHDDVSDRNAGIDLSGVSLQHFESGTTVGDVVVGGQFVSPFWFEGLTIDQDVLCPAIVGCTNHVETNACHLRLLQPALGAAGDIIEQLLNLSTTQEHGRDGVVEWHGVVQGV